MFKNYFDFVKRFLNDPEYKQVINSELNQMYLEGDRVEVINFILKRLNRVTSYLELGANDLDTVFYKVNSFQKISVGYEEATSKNNPLYKMENDHFFNSLRDNQILHSDKKWDLIFINGFHLAGSLYSYVLSALDFIKEDGFIIIQGCNPPTEWHAREKGEYHLSPARFSWYGTAWKAFLKLRQSKTLFSCCVDVDTGIGIISKKVPLGRLYSSDSNVFFEFKDLNQNRKKALNLMTLEEFKFLIYSLTQ